MVEQWLRAEPEISAKTLMHRLCGLFPDVYPTGAQLRTLQRRVQLWRNEQVKRLIFESTGAQVSASDPAPVNQNVEATTIPTEVKLE